MFLVKDKAIPAMCISPLNYGERSIHDPITNLKLYRINYYFPHLKFTLFENITRGAINEYTRVSAPEDTKMGVLISMNPQPSADMSMRRKELLLGYSCPGQSSGIGIDSASVTMSIVVELNKEIQGKRTVTILANVCNNRDTSSKMSEIAVNVDRSLKKNFITTDIYSRTTVEIENNLPIAYIIKNMIKTRGKGGISTQEKNEAHNFLETIRMYIANTEDNKNNLSFSNPIHQGILLTLLTIFKNDGFKPAAVVDYMKELNREFTTKKKEKTGEHTSGTPILRKIPVHGLQFNKKNL